MEKSQILNQLTHGEWGADLLNKDQEIEHIEEFAFYPVEPIKIVDARVHMDDDFNGDALVEFNNGDKIEYRCREIRGGDCGPETDMLIFLNGKCIDLSFDLSEWGGYAWTKMLTNYYIKNELYAR